MQSPPKAANDPSGAITPASGASPTAASHGRPLLGFLLLIYLATLANVSRVLPDAAFEPLGWAFGVSAITTYAALYTSPVGLLSLIVWWLTRARRSGAAAALGVAAVGGAVLQMTLLIDIAVYRAMGFHLNGFVWNLVSTPGGMDSIGASDATVETLVAILLGLLVGHGVVAWAVSRRPAFTSRLTPRRVAGLVAFLVLLGAAQMVSFAAADVMSEKRVLRVAGAVPWYVRVTAKGLAFRLFGIDRKSLPGSPRMGTADERGAVRYPLRPLALAPTRERLNVLWLVCESWRADMVDPVIMPATHAFARRAQWFRNHLSGGNGTRFGMFSMFYGLYATYWFRFLEERRGPVLLDHLLQDGYRLRAHTSANFTFPEFDETVFGALPPDAFVTATPTDSTWERDLAMVERLLSFIDEESAAPFFAFMFFESPHARYQFPLESPLRADYLPELNYATVDVARDMPRIKARYENSCNFLDSQLERVLDHVEREGLLDSTIIVLTGDHGEEFMEHGRWGHNSAFSSEQVMTPMILWVPGLAPAARTDMTSHLDLPATVLRALGVTNPPADYSQGNDLLGPARREWTVLADWWSVTYADAHDRIIWPLGSRFDGVVALRDDIVVEDPSEIIAARHDRLLEVARGMRTFMNR